MAGTIVDFIFFNGKNYITVKRTFSEVRGMFFLADYVLNSDFLTEYLAAGYFLKTINIL